MATRPVPPAPQPWCLAALLLCGSAAAQDSIANNFIIGTAQNREVIVPLAANASAQLTTSAGPMFAQSAETGSVRMHTVSFGGETFRASTPLEGPASRIAFDPAQRRFVALLPSIRVEMNDFSRLDAIVDNLGATGATPFESLGFAVIELPEALHPAEAIEMLGSLPEAGEASLRLRGPRIRLW